MTADDRFIRDAQASMGLELGEPVRVQSDDLAPCSCLECRRPVWNLPAGRTSDGRAMTFDLEHSRGDPYLSLHPCHYQDSPELDDPDYGWVEVPGRGI